jgi:pyridoxamine 5'-phosphate oxidase
MADEWTPDYYTAPQAGDLAAAEEPFVLFEAWFADAKAHEPNDPNAMSVASVDAAGMPNVRVTLLKGLDGPGADPRGFVFYTNLESAKGRELLASGRAALAFHWKSLRRQVRVRGLVSVVSDAEADAYFATRPRGSRIGAWASQQSRPLESRFALEQAVAMYAAKFAIGEVPRPPHWSGFRVTPLEFEFWHDRPFRLHERIAFRRDAPGEPWRKERLYP